jgi:hypothetical protein
MIEGTAFVLTSIQKAGKKFLLVGRRQNISFLSHQDTHGKTLAGNALHMPISTINPAPSGKLSESCLLLCKIEC